MLRKGLAIDLTIFGKNIDFVNEKEEKMMSYFKFKPLKVGIYYYY
jgi:hypothetical protein